MRQKIILNEKCALQGWNGLKYCLMWYTINVERLKEKVWKIIGKVHKNIIHLRTHTHDLQIVQPMHKPQSCRVRQKISSNFSIRQYCLFSVAILFKSTFSTVCFLSTNGGNKTYSCFFSNYSIIKYPSWTGIEISWVRKK